MIQFLSVITLLLASDLPDKPRDRSGAETKLQNLARYELGTFGEDAPATIGVDVKYFDVDPQGVSITRFDIDSRAKAQGLLVNDIILEVNGSAVGKIRGRHYEPWKLYRRLGPTIAPEFLVSFVTPNGRHYYYPHIPVTDISETRIVHRDDFFTSPQPRDRASPESAGNNRARYVIGAGNFDKYARYRLGVNIKYSYSDGAKITKVEPGTPAAAAGLKVGDLILEVGGAPVGVFNDRVYEIWRQYQYLRSNKVEFLVTFYDTPTQSWKYYYPIIELETLGSPN